MSNLDSGASEVLWDTCLRSRQPLGTAEAIDHLVASLRRLPPHLRGEAARHARHRLDEALGSVIADAARQMRSNHMTWAQIGAALGVTPGHAANIASGRDELRREVATLRSFGTTRRDGRDVGRRTTV